MNLPPLPNLQLRPGHLLGGIDNGQEKVYAVENREPVNNGCLSRFTLLIVSWLRIFNCALFRKDCGLWVGVPSERTTYKPPLGLRWSAVALFDDDGCAGGLEVDHVL